MVLMIFFVRVEVFGFIIEVMFLILIVWEEGVMVNKKRERNNGFSFMVYFYKEVEVFLFYWIGVGYIWLDSLDCIKLNVNVVVLVIVG